MRSSLMALAVASLALLSAPAKADNFSFTANGGYTGTGTLTATDNGDGSFLVTGITGTGITGLLPVNSGDIFLNDNLILPGQSRLLTVEGLAFSTLLGGFPNTVNLFSDLNGYQALVEDANGIPSFSSETFNVTAAATPEPSSLLLLGTGLFGAGAALVRRRRSA